MIFFLLFFFLLDSGKTQETDMPESILEIQTEVVLKNVTGPDESYGCNIEFRVTTHTPATLIRQCDARPVTDAIKMFQLIEVPIPSSATEVNGTFGIDIKGQCGFVPADTRDCGNFNTVRDKLTEIVDADFRGISHTKSVDLTLDESIKLKVTITGRGPRFEDLNFEEDEILELNGPGIFTANRVTFHQNATLSLMPFENTVASDTRTHLLPRLVAQSVNFEAGSKVSINFNGVDTNDVLIDSVVVEAINLTGVPNEFLSDGLDPEMIALTMNTSRNGVAELRAFVERNREFNSPDDDAFFVVIIGLTAICLCCIVMIVCCCKFSGTRNAQKGSVLSAPVASPQQMMSGRPTNQMSAADDSRMMSTRYDTRGSNAVAMSTYDTTSVYDSPPPPATADFHSTAGSFILDNTPQGGTTPQQETMMLPPAVSDYDQSVYAQVPEAIRTDDDPWELNHGDLQLGRVLGEGAYGTVNEATWRGKKVAVKRMLTKSMAPADIKAFKKEAKLMKSLTVHPNVVGLVGVNTDETRGELFIVVEFCSGGACDEYLKKYGHLLTQQQRVSMMVAAARGVHHLHEQSIIHRDLACRNFLLTEGGGLKVADFGMSRDTTQDGNKTKASIGPLRYMAPEAMSRQEYSRQTDCWAFGVVMWEICSDAATPYGTMPLTQVAIGVAKEGLRLEQPDECADSLYELMHRCWAHKPEDRPTFPEIDEQLFDDGY